VKLRGSPARAQQFILPHRAGGRIAQAGQAGGSHRRVPGSRSPRSQGVVPADGPRPGFGTEGSDGRSPGGIPQGRYCRSKEGLPARCPSPKTYPIASPAESVYLGRIDSDANHVKRTLTVPQTRAHGVSRRHIRALGFSGPSRYEMENARLSPRCIYGEPHGGACNFVRRASELSRASKWYGNTRLTFPAHHRS